MSERDRILEDCDSSISATTFLARVARALWAVLARSEASQVTEASTEPTRTSASTRE